MRAQLPLLIVSFVGCAGVTHVVSTGPDTYMVASHGTMGWSSGPAQKAKAFEETISATDSGPGIYGKISSGEVQFRCTNPTAK